MLKNIYACIYFFALQYIIFSTILSEDSLGLFQHRRACVTTVNRACIVVTAKANCTFSVQISSLWLKPEKSLDKLYSLQLLEKNFDFFTPRRVNAVPPLKMNHQMILTFLTLFQNTVSTFQTVTMKILWGRRMSQIHVVTLKRWQTSETIVYGNGLSITNDY